VALLGAHVPTAGGVWNAFLNAHKIGGEALQIFVKNANRWAAKPFTEEDVGRFRAAREAHGEPPVVAHAAYLINLAATNPDTLQKSRAALADELTRCEQLGIPGLVLHPGAHVGAGEAAGLEAVARSLDCVLGGLPGSTVQVWLENTAGQGTVLGADLAHLARIVELSDHPSRLGVCLDTCHAFTAGYDLRSGGGYEAFLEEVGVRLGLSRVGCWHLNDSKHPLGSRRDRHANLGEGELGLEAFARPVHDARFSATPMLLETPVGEDGLGHARDLARLRAL